MEQARPSGGFTPPVAVAELTPEVRSKLEALRALLATMPGVIVAYSGGVDSSFLLAVAFEILGNRSLALTARSASLMGVELEAASAFARALGVRHELVDTHEIDRPGYQANAGDRCYHCKTELFDATTLRARLWQGAVVVDGFNQDDEHDHRFGRRAALEHGVRHPLVEVGLSKAEIRALSRALGLATWNKPQLACLASRLPQGMEVTRERLTRVEQVELALRGLGFFDLRARLVRENDDLVRIELGEAELERAVQRDVRRRIVQAALSAGFRFVTLDLEGFRSGRLAEVAPPLVQLGRRPA